MKVSFDFLPEFERRAKELQKKYLSFEHDYDVFLDELELNPFSGESLSLLFHSLQVTPQGSGSVRCTIL